MPFTISHRSTDLQAPPAFLGQSMNLADGVRKFFGQSNKMPAGGSFVFPDPVFKAVLFLLGFGVHFTA